MKIILITAVILILLGAAAAILALRSATGGGVQGTVAVSDDVSSPGFWDLESRGLDGDPVSLDRWRGHVALVVNVASNCGFTPQYAGLMDLQREYARRGFTVLGFPCNDFLGQEPGSPAEIRAFCDAEYGVAFPLFAKVRVKGGDKSRIYRFLTATGLAEPSWNFTKYLVSRTGKVLFRFPPGMEPDDPELRSRLEDALDS
ncbi:glutathione peroxidase [bacterium]|nr:glutathione peroxidase [bacterium]MBU1071891.1 glutathione peroxidase [bacterium]MBU1676603.1 glutathione peroxidase [bacterium]